MSVAHRALAVLPVAVLAMAAPSANAAPTVTTQPCVPYIAGQKTMLLGVAGFAPNGFVEVNTASAASPTPRILTSFRVDGIGGFAEADFPPSFTKSNGNIEEFTLAATDKITNPAAPLVAITKFQVVRFGLTRSPTPKKPSSRVTITARGFVPGKPVYVHFRFKGKTYRTVSLGNAEGVCGIAAKKMKALPTKTRYGTWKAYVDQTKKFSVSTRPQWIDSFRIYRTFG
jgi:hypothetical protein